MYPRKGIHAPQVYTRGAQSMCIWTALPRGSKSLQKSVQGLLWARSCCFGVWFFVPMKPTKNLVRVNSAVCKAPSRKAGIVVRAKSPTCRSERRFSCTSMGNAKSNELHLSGALWRMWEWSLGIYHEGVVGITTITPSLMPNQTSGRQSLALLPRAALVSKICCS